MREDPRTKESEEAESKDGISIMESGLLKPNTLLSFGVSSLFSTSCASSGCRQENRAKKAIICFVYLFILRFGGHQTFIMIQRTLFWHRYARQNHAVSDWNERAVFIYSIPKNAHFFLALYFDRRRCFQSRTELLNPNRFINTISDTYLLKMIKQYILSA
ncbi:hypothetical protein HQ29_06045 [Porphyromonas canoris]|nr:hypothetical protein HQ29_06045 [Porphyromonas canoris]